MRQSEGASRVISSLDWDKRRNAVQPAREDMNMLVMNYLVTEGYLDAAKQFEEESGTPAGVDLNSAADRMHIRTALEKGQIEDAIEQINDLNPEILEENSELFFHIQQQQMIELIRQQKIEEALCFAQEYLASKGEENPAFLDDLESTIALVAFANPAESPVKELMDVGQRQKTASELNSAILAKHDQEREPRLAAIMKMLTWGQQQLSEKATFPQMIDLSTGELSKV